MIDYGLVCMFAIECGLVLACAFAYARISTKIVELKSLRTGIDNVPVLLKAFEVRMTEYSDRIAVVEAAPATTKKRFEQLDAAIADGERESARIAKLVASAGARISVLARWSKREKDDDDETDPAPEGEGNEDANASMPPGSHRRQEPPAPQVVPPGFGVTRRRMGNG